MYEIYGYHNDDVDDDANVMTNVYEHLIRLNNLQLFDYLDLWYYLVGIFVNDLYN